MARRLQTTRLLQSRPKLRKRKGSPYWQVRYLDPATRRETNQSTGTTDKGVAEKLRSDKQFELERVAMGVVDESFTQRGVKPLALLDEFGKQQELKGNSQGYIRKTIYRIDQGLQFMDLRAMAVLQGEGNKSAKRFLGSLKDKAPKTRDDYAASLTLFGKWLVEEGYLELGKNPFDGLPRIAKKEQPTLRHATFTPSELEQLALAACERPVACYLRSHPNAQSETLERLRQRGEGRSRRYRVAGFLGMRLSALKGIKWSDLKNGILTIRARINRKTLKARHLNVGDPVLAELFEQEREAQASKGGKIPSGSDAIFPMSRHHLRDLRKDAHYAGLCDADGYRDDGTRATWHGLRHTAVTNLCAVASPSVVAELVGHTRTSTTARYTHLSAADGTQAMSTVIAKSGRSGGHCGGHENHEAPIPSVAS